MDRTISTLARVCLLICFIFSDLQAQNCTFNADRRLNSQADLNDFDVSCTSVKGNIVISGEDITDLSPLKNIESIDGSLTISTNPNLTSLKGLEKLKTVKNLFILINNLLTDLTGLNGLSSISGMSQISYNKKLVSLKV